MQFTLNKKLEHYKLQQCAQSRSKGHPGYLVLHITVQLYMSSAFKRKSAFVRINTDVLAY